MSKTDGTNPLHLVEIEKKNNNNNNTPQIIVNRIQDFTTPNSNGKSYIQIPPLSKKSTKRTDSNPLDSEKILNKDKENDNNLSQTKHNNNLTISNNINNNKLYLSPNVIQERSSNNSDHSKSRSRNILSPNPIQLSSNTNRGKYSTIPSNEMTKVIFKEPPKFLAAKKEINTNNNNNKAKRTDRNGVPICKGNKKKIKVTFIDQIDESKKFEEIIDIESIKKYNICYGLPKEDKYIKETVCCSCILF